MKVKELASRNLFTAAPHDTLESLREKMTDFEVHALPVVDDSGQPVGIVTASDLTPDLPDEMALVDLMSDQVYTIDANADAREAARTMRDLGVHHLIVTENSAAVGMLSSFDLLRALEAA